MIKKIHSHYIATSLKFIIGIILIGFILLNLIIQISLFSFSKNHNIKTSVGISFYNIFNNKLSLFNFNIYNPTTFNEKKAIIFPKIEFLLNKEFLLKNTFIVKSAKFSKGNLNLFINEEGDLNIEELFLNRRSKKVNSRISEISQIKKNYLHSSLFSLFYFDQFLIEKFELNSDVTYSDIDGSSNVIAYMVIGGNNISNIESSEWADIQIIANSYINDSDFNIRLDVDLAPIISSSKPTFKINGSVLNLSPEFWQDSLSDLKLTCTSFSMDSYLICNEGQFEDSQIILRLNNTTFLNSESDSEIQKMQFNIPVYGTFNDPDFNFTPALKKLGGHAIENIFHIMYESLDLSDLEDNIKDELRTLDDKLSISEWDEKFKEEYDRIEDDIKEVIFSEKENSHND